jgi:hypothetical protein
MAAELLAVGVTLDFAPVLDVLTNAKNPAIGDRALSDRVEDVATLGRTLIEAFQGAGLAAAGKHFPGHGDTGVDSHLDLPICELPPDRLRAVELVPFRAAIAADVAVMLTCHVLFTEIDAEYPATLSPRIVQAMLKDELGYQGPVITDDLDMKAIAARYTIEETVVRCLRAVRTQRLIAALVRWIRQGTWLERYKRGKHAEALQSYCAGELKRWHGRLVRKGRHLKRLSESRRHRLRIKVKRFRYMLEALAKTADLGGRSEWRDLHRPAKRLQRALGDLRDLERFADLAGGLPHAENGKRAKQRPPGYRRRKKKLLDAAMAAHRDLKQTEAR